MAFIDLFRKKNVQDILKQVEKNEADGHHSLGKHLTTRDLTAFGIAAIVGAGIFSTIGKASADGGPAVIFLFFIYRHRLRICRFCLCRICFDGSGFGQCLYLFVCGLWRDYRVDYRLGPDHGVCHWEYYRCHFLE